MALGGPGAGARRVVDMSCGGGALLLAAGDALVAAGADRADVAREMLWGADIDPLAVAVTEAAIALWSGGARPAKRLLVVADTLPLGSDAGPLATPRGFDALVGDPPSQGQRVRVTAPSRPTAPPLQHPSGAAAT